MQPHFTKSVELQEPKVISNQVILIVCDNTNNYKRLTYNKQGSLKILLTL